MATSAKKPSYSLLLNPHLHERLSRCPHCNALTYPRKFALMIHVDGWLPYIQGKTCKYCSRCEMIMVQQDELEGEIARSVRLNCPSALGNEYHVVGVVDTKTFKAGLAGTAGPAKTLFDHLIEFRKQYGLSVKVGGLYPAGAEQRELPATKPQRVPRE